MSCRRRPLHSWGVSAIAIVNKAYIKAQALNEPLALMAANLLTLTAHMVSYFIHCLQHFWLSIFFFVDDCILALENMVETVFPSSKHVFDKVDEVIETIETLPGKFDDVLNEFSVIIKQVPLLDWTLSRLKLILTRWSIENSKEKDIVVDQNEEKLSEDSINDDENLKNPENETEKTRVVEMVDDQSSVNDNEKLKTAENEAEKIMVSPIKLKTPENEAEKIMVSPIKLKTAEKIMVSPISATGTCKGTYKDILKSKETYNDVSDQRGNRETNVKEKKKKKKMKKVGIQIV